MELVELEPLANSIVGKPGISGLSVEQRKRLTIAVELVANPSIIFMVSALLSPHVLSCPFADKGGCMRVISACVQPAQYFGILGGRQMQGYCGSTSQKLLERISARPLDGPWTSEFMRVLCAG